MSLIVFSCEVHYCFRVYCSKGVTVTVLFDLLVAKLVRCPCHILMVGKTQSGRLASHFGGRITRASNIAGGSQVMHRFLQIVITQVFIDKPLLKSLYGTISILKTR